MEAREREREVEGVRVRVGKREGMEEWDGEGMSERKGEAVGKGVAATRERERKSEEKTNT